MRCAPAKTECRARRIVPARRRRAPQRMPSCTSWSSTGKRSPGRQVIRRTQSRCPGRRNGGRSRPPGSGRRASMPPVDDDGGRGAVDLAAGVVVEAQQSPPGAGMHHVFAQLVHLGGARNGGHLAREPRDLFARSHDGRVAQQSGCWNMRRAPATLAYREAVVTRPLIGISSYAAGRDNSSRSCEYVDVVRLAGGVPIVLPAVKVRSPRKRST